MLKECMEFLEEKVKQEPYFKYEVIVVSDGSKDKTVECALKYSKKYTCEKFRVLELVENRGKGGAVRYGMMSSRGKYLLFADAGKFIYSMISNCQNWMGTKQKEEINGNFKFEKHKLII